MKEDSPKEMKKVALYIRVSTDEQAEKYGVELQRTALESLIRSKPDSFVFAGDNYVYIDNGVSGTLKIEDRPAFARLKEDLAFAPEDDRPFDLVAVYKIDRFARQLKILLDVIELLDDHNVQFVSANESIDTSTPFGKAMLGIIGIIAELERDTIVKRTSDGRWEAFEQGVVLGNSAPYGYTKDEFKRYKILETEAEVVRETFRLFVEDRWTVDRIAKHLFERKILSPVASSLYFKKRKGEIKKKNEMHFWTPGAVRRLLDDEIYIGKIYGNKSKKGKLTPKGERRLSSTPSPFIVDVRTFGKAQQLLGQAKHTKQSARDGHIYLLSGLLKCDCCFDSKIDGPLERIGWHGERRNVKGQWQYYYKCGRKNLSKTSTLCRSIPIHSQEIEDYIVDYAKKLLESPVAVFEYQKNLQSSLTTVEHLQKQDKNLVDLISAIPHSKNRLSEQHVEGLLGLNKLKEKLQELEKRNKRLEQQRGEIQMQLSQHALSKGYIDALDLFSKKYSKVLDKKFDDRAALAVILRTLIEEVVIYTRPTKKTDPIAGRKKENQEIPNRIHIKLKLPSDILHEIAPEAVTSVERYGFDGEDSTPSSGSKSIGGAR